MKLDNSSIFSEFIAANPTSRAHAERARAVIPTGLSRGLLRHPPFPFYTCRGESAWTMDLDGNRRLDFHNNYTALMHGHAHPEIIATVNEQLPLGSAFSGPPVQEFELAATLCERIASVEQVVFNNSGSEAVMVALRAARALTGRDRIGLFEGCYHGSSDFVLVGGHDLPAPDDPRRLSEPLPDMAGIPSAATRDVVLMRYNDAQAVRDAVTKYGEELAAIVVEPILGAGGVIPAEPEFLRVLREETTRAGIILICDEVISLRHAVGGAQAYYGLQPDLTTMAKIIGGGYPIGALGGRRDHMRCFDTPDEGGTIANLGTFSANPISCRAGVASMRLLDEATISDLDKLGTQTRTGLCDRIAKYAAPAQVSGTGSLFQIHWTEAPLHDARGAETADPELNLLTFLGLANRGVHLSVRGIGALSTPMTAGDIESLLSAFDDTLAVLRQEGRF